MRISSIFLLFSVLFLVSCTGGESDEVKSESQVKEELVPKLFYGLSEEDYDIIHDTIRSNQFLSDILAPHGISYAEIENIASLSRDIFDVRDMKVGRPYHLFLSKDTASRAYCMIYERDPTSYVDFCFSDSLYVTIGEKLVEYKEAKASGVINSSLFVTMMEQELSPALAMEMADIYAWTIDFYKLNKGDRFKVIYEEKYVDDMFIGIGDIKSCLFEHSGKEFYAFAFESDSVSRFVDEKGLSLKKAFLKSPLKFGRLTSRYSMRRFHPVQRRNKPHLGTDYAAPRGTPIMATRAGTVIDSKYRGGNGNYVKVKHNSVYTTQYLHMSKRAVRVGDFVQQGDVIGYVGSTGLATGPHVCYRFWKDGKQVDPLREKSEPTEPLSEELMAEFQLLKPILKTSIDSISYPIVYTDTLEIDSVQ